MRVLVFLCAYYTCSVYGFLNPVFGILFFVHITLFRPDNMVWGRQAFGPLHLITGVLILAGFLLRRHRVVARKVFDPQWKNTAVFLLFLGALLLSSAFTEFSSAAGYEQIINVAKIWMICFLFSCIIVEEEQFHAYVWVSIVSLGLLAAWGVEQGLRGNPRLDTLTVGGSNYLAAQLVLLAPVALAKACEAGVSRPARAVAWFCAVAMALCVVYSDSRGGFLGLVVAMVCFLWRGKARLGVWVGLGLACLLVVYMLPESYSQRISSIFVESSERDLSAQARPVLWKIGLRVWQDHPIIGVGLENFSDAKETLSAKVDDLVTSREMYDHIFGVRRYTHGLYPGLLAETGILGTLLFLLLLFGNATCRFPKSFVDSVERKRLMIQVVAAQAGLLGFAVSALFGDFQYIELLYFQIFFVGAVRCYAGRIHQAAAARDRMVMGTSREPVIVRSGHAAV